MVPREVTMVAHPMVSIKVPSLRVTMTVAPLRVIEPRVPVISQEDNIEDIIQMDMVESEKVQQKHHRHPTRITQLSQEMNQVEHTSTPSHNTRHQQWLMNLHEQMKDTPQLINTCIQENLVKQPQSMTHNEYLTQMSNEIID